MSRIWQAVLRWIARAMECLSHFLQAWADYIRGKISDPPEGDLALRDGELTPDAVWDGPEGRRIDSPIEDLEGLESPPASFHAGSTTAASSIPSRRAPPHWVADLHRIRTQSDSAQKNADLGDSAEETSEESPAGDRERCGTGTSHSQCHGTPATPSRRDPVPTPPSVEEIPRNPVQSERPDINRNPSGAINRDPSTLKAQRNLATEDAEAIAVNSSQEELTQPQPVKGRRYAPALRLLQPSRESGLDIAHVTDHIEPSPSGEVHLPSGFEKPRLQPASELHSTELPAQPVDELSIEPRKSAAHESLASQDEMQTGDAREAAAAFLDARPIWPELAPVEDATYERVLQKIRKAADNSPWPDLPAQHWSHLARSNEEVRLRLQRRAAERIRRLEQEQRGE